MAENNVTNTNTTNSIDNARKYGTKLWKKKVRKFFNNRLAVFGLLVVVIFLVLMIGAPIFTKWDPNAPNFKAKLVGPNAEHLLGTDSLGRDLFARILYGGRTSVLIAVVSSFIGSTIGTILGAIGGYFEGFVDKCLVRLQEIVSCFPQLILVLIVVAFIGPGTWNLILIFALTGWTGCFRLVRSEFIARKEETYVKVCEAFGMSNVKIMFSQILPSVLTTVIVQLTMNIPGYVMQEAGLSFLGFGVPMNTPTWGTMLNAAKASSILINNPHCWLVPGLAISLFVLAVNFFGDGLRDVMDPRQQ